MLQSQFFAKTEKTAPQDEKAINARLLMRGGYVDKSMAGVYSLLPLGLRVVRNIESVVREEMNALGAQELLMPALQPKELWDETGRWEKLHGDMYQFTDSSEKPLGLGFTHEEVVIALARKRVFSYKDLPLYLYQIQRKFRDEPRPRSGLLRGRDFFMKDMYSFHASKKDLDNFYENAAAPAYTRVFNRLGLKTIYTEAGGGVFTKERTHEFQVLSSGGEDTIFYCGKCSFAQNKEIAEARAGDNCPLCKGKGSVQESRAIEVGNIFRFNDVMTKKMNFFYADDKGEKQPVFFGSYGIGITRLLGTLVEVYHKGEGAIKWPAHAAPFLVHILALKEDEAKNDFKKLEQALLEKKIDFLYDDRSAMAPGEKFADADLIGSPVRVILGGRAKKGFAGVVGFNGDKEEELSISELISKLTAFSSSV